MVDQGLSSIQKIGLFGGTFNPIHFGHINLALELFEIHNLNQVWFIPTRLSPYKLNEIPLPIEHRVRMIELAIKDIPTFSLLDIEFQRPAPSYTIDTLNIILSDPLLATPGREFYLMLGEDAAPSFFKWSQAEEIIDMVHLLIGSRSGEWNFSVPEMPVKVEKALRRGLTKTRVMDISSTDLKKRLYRNYCGHLIPAKVIDYIYKNQLYFKNSETIP